MIAISSELDYVGFCLGDHKATKMTVGDAIILAPF